MSGLDPTGFQIKTLTEILAEIEASELADIDAELDTSPDEPIGQLNAIFSKHLAEAWELLETAFHSMDPEAAEDHFLDQVSAITGTKRTDDQYGTVALDCTLNIGTTLPTTAMAAVASDATNRWVLDERVYPSGYTAPSTGVHSVKFRSELIGTKTALSGTITVIVTAVSGWSAVTNPLDAVPGVVRETDEQLRVKRLSELTSEGSCTLQALAADLRKVTGIISVKCIENTSNVSIGALPPHSFEAIIWDGISPGAIDSVIAQTIWENKPAGIQAVGSTTEDFKDEFGDTQSASFSRVLQLQASMHIVLAKNADHYPADGDTRVKEALVNAGNPTKANGKLPGADIIYNSLFGVIYGACPGIDDITFMQVGIVGLVPEGTSNIFIDDDQIAVWDTSRIVVS